MHTNPATPLPPPAGRSGAGGHPQPAARAEPCSWCGLAHEGGPEFCEALDSLESYNEAVRMVGESVKAGAPVPAFMRGRNPGRFTAVALELPEGLPFDDWQAIGAQLGQVERAVGWWIGDWWTYGHRYGERVAITTDGDWHGPSFDVCHAAGFVCRKFETVRRRTVLSFTHHREVAGLSPGDADRLLDDAIACGWSTRELRTRALLVRNHIGAPLSGDTCSTDDLHSLIAAGQQFGTIYADPPWLYGNQATRAATGNHYGGMSVDEIAALPIADLAAPNAHLHLWTTNGFLFECPRIMAAWGFEYKSCFVWVKPGFGTGNYWRLAHEFLLFGVRGSAPFQDRGLISWGEYERGPHSTKPEDIRDLIEKASPSPRLELFARRVAPGWTVWGDSIERDLFFAAAD